MNLFVKYLELEIPQTNSSKTFNAETIPEFYFAKIGINYLGFPVIIISSKFDNYYLAQKNIKLKYIELTHNLECRVTENGNTKIDTFSIILFKNNQKYLQKYFLEIVISLLRSLSQNPSSNEVFVSFKNFVEIFRSLNDTPTNTVQGLWAELLLIEQSKNPTVLINYWHINPEEKFDFNANIEKLEVKSNSNLERVHTFTSEQLNPVSEHQVVICSIFTKQATSGLTVLDLLERILPRVPEIDLHEKLYRTVAKTLGNTFEQTTKIKYDYDLGKNSIRFYKHQDISKVEKLNIPNRVSEVKFKSDLTDIKDINLRKINITEQLFIHI